MFGIGIFSHGYPRGGLLAIDPSSVDCITVPFLRAHYSSFTTYTEDRPRVSLQNLRERLTHNACLFEGEFGRKSEQARRLRLLHGLWFGPDRYSTCGREYTKADHI
eukprot:9495696-Pyramimonas_sp.AAC.2